MDVSLRLVQDRSVRHRVDAPCKGLAAKALGKYKLEEQTGLSVKFLSYQAAPGQPEKQLADDDPVQRGAILNFSVNMDTMLQQQRQHSQLLKGLYRERLQTVLAKYSARFCAAPVAQEDLRNRGGVAAQFASAPQKSESAAAALACVGSQMTAAEFAQQLDTIYVARNGEFACMLQCSCYNASLAHLHAHMCAETQHVNTDAQLESELRLLRTDGVVQLCSETMPFECMIVDHYETFLQLLPGYQSQ
jgi:hypothetical protein